MKPFLPVFAFAVVSFLLLAAFVSYASPNSELRLLLYLSRLAAWVVALAVSTTLFLVALRRRRLGVHGAVFFAAVTIMMFYPCDGYFKAHAEERIIRHKSAHRDPSDDMGPAYIYGSFSPGAGGSSRGAMDAAEYAWRSFCWGAAFSLLWFPFVYAVSLIAYGLP